MQNDIVMHALEDQAFSEAAKVKKINVSNNNLTTLG